MSALGCTCREGVLCIPCYREIEAGRRRVATCLDLPASLQPGWRPPAVGSNELQQRVHAMCEALGGWKIHSLKRSDKAKTEAGFPDDLLVGHGRMIAAEYKAEGQLVTLAQQGWLQAFWLHNPTCEVYAYWPSDEVAIAACLRGPKPWPRDRQWMTRLPLPCQCGEVG